MQNFFRALVLGFATISLAACGGSGNSGLGSPAPEPENLAEITSANAEAIASSVMKATFEGGEIGAFADLSGGIGGAGALKPDNAFTKVGDAQMQWTKPMLTDSQVGTFEAPIGPIDEACLESGSTVITGEIADPETLSPNDVITIQFLECYDGITTVNGTMSMTINSFSGDFVAEDVSFSVTVTLTDLSVTEAEVTSTADGSLTLGMDLPLSGAITMTMSSEDLSISDGTTTESLADFSLSQTIDPVTGVYTLTVSGTLSSSTFSGAVNFTTSATFEGMGADSAHLGQLVITGDANATITVDVLDDQFIRLSIDLDGDDVADEVIDVAWEELV